MASATERLASFICGFERSTVPGEAISNTKGTMLDCIGVALAGSQEPVGKIMRAAPRSRAQHVEVNLQRRKEIR